MNNNKKKYFNQTFHVRKGQSESNHNKYCYAYNNHVKNYNHKNEK